MLQTLRLTDLRAMTERDRNALFDRLVAEANQPSNGQLESVKARIRNYELQYEMSSPELLEKLGRDEIKETADVSSWLFLLSVRDRHESRQARTQQAP